MNTRIMFTPAPLLGVGMIDAFLIVLVTFWRAVDSGPNASAISVATNSSALASRRSSFGVLCRT